MLKKIIFILIVTFCITSCSNTFDSVKRGLTGAKANSADEFLVKKKDPLILPPDFENLPTPDERSVAKEEFEIFEKSLEATIEENSTQDKSVENSIIKKIQSK
jgi:hypothetical protein